MNKKHKHAEFICAWANGEPVQVQTESGWHDIGGSPSFSEYNSYRLKPAEPERNYPLTSMSNIELKNVWQEKALGCGPVSTARVVANAALRHACDAGQIVTREEFDRAVGDRKARDLAVAEAVDAAWRTQCLRLVPGSDHMLVARLVDLSSTIKGVKP